LKSIQKRILQTFSDKFTDKSLIKHPAYHENVGDNMLNYGEFVLMDYFSRNNTECGVFQSLIECCRFVFEWRRFVDSIESWIPYQCAEETANLPHLWMVLSNSLCF
jgi:hypothetical protein